MVAVASCSFGWWRGGATMVVVLCLAGGLGVTGAIARIPGGGCQEELRRGGRGMVSDLADLLVVTTVMRLQPFRLQGWHA